jgi:SNF2 family DNA or RNA helicase
MEAENSATTAEPKLARGGILADDMGLGKTLQYSLLSWVCGLISGL